MIRRRILWLGALLAAAGAAQAEEVAWQPWSNEAFAQARRERKLVLLDLEAVWCHWCHVMDATTYRDPAVTALLASKYIALKVDQDSRPDLANRYEDYGWPATVIYAPDGEEIVKKRGYITPEGMARLLRTVAADPTPAAGEAAAAAPAGGPAALSPERRAALHRQWLAGYDRKAGGWGFSHKYLEWDSVELALREAARGDRDAADRARETLRLQRQLLDPVWGGMYQYSAGGGWNEPHYEKIMSVQAENLRIYALAYAQWGDPADLKTAQAIHGYMRNFLRTPAGAFATSQDADLVPGEQGDGYFKLDDAGRRARGMPRIDTHLYARENGWAIASLAVLAAVTDEEQSRREADFAAWWARDHRILPGGGFAHGDKDAGGPYLADTLAMGQACFALYEATAYGPWLTHAAEAARFIHDHFSRRSAPGFAATDTSRPSFPAPEPEFDENVGVARLAAAVANATGEKEFREEGASALAWLLTPGLAESRGFYVAGLLLAEEELRVDPLHVAIIGPRDNSVARALYATAIRAPNTHKLVEWWDPNEGLAPRGEDIYPSLSRPAAFVCDHGACSAPIFDPAALVRRLGVRP